MNHHGRHVHRRRVELETEVEGLRFELEAAKRALIAEFVPLSRQAEARQWGIAWVVEYACEHHGDHHGEHPSIAREAVRGQFTKD